MNLPKIWSVSYVGDPGLNLPEPDMVVDIEVHFQHGPDHWAQALYLAHGLEDVLWTDSLDEAIEFVKRDLAKLEATS